MNTKRKFYESESGFGLGDFALIAALLSAGVAAGQLTELWPMLKSFLASLQGGINLADLKHNFLGVVVKFLENIETKILFGRDFIRHDLGLGLSDTGIGIGLISIGIAVATSGLFVRSRMRR